MIFYRVRHKSEPSECSTPESETLKVLSISSRALSNPNLENEEDQALELAGLTRTISDPSLEEEECNINELNLTEEELEEFNLKLGINEAEFSVTTQYQGRSERVVTDRFEISRVFFRNNPVLLQYICLGTNR